MQLSAKNRPKGFALLITITLLAFLVLLLVSLASLTRVETQVASNNQQLAQARQNALMALNIAIGELQKYTGPDQRTTARSDMDATLANTTTASGRWLGAYGSGAEADYSMQPSAISTAIAGASDTKGSQAKLLNWLVSGNETTAFDPSTHVGTKGNITAAPSTFQFSPSGIVDGLSASVTATTDSLTVTDKDNAPKPARLLVGPNTTGSSIADYVVAPLREITAEAPGMGTTPVPVGRYAWWVGDEGSKARVNLPIATTAQANAFVSAQRAAVELMDAFNPSASTSLASAKMLDPTGADARYDPSSPLLSKLLSAAQLPLLSTSAATALGTLSQYRYHDLSLWSTSVLSDTYAGGLKKDLSSILADISPSLHASPQANDDFLFPPETANGARPQLGLPTWSLLRSHVQTTSSSAGLTPSPPEMVKLAAYTVPIPSTVGVGPILTYAFIGMSYGVPTTVAPPWDLAGNPIKLAISPIVVLWNPYNCDLLPAKYEVGFRKNSMGRFELQAKNSTDTGAWAAKHRLHVGNLDDFNGANDKFMRFVIDNSTGIPAGQSLIFTLGQNGLTYSAASTTNPLVNEYHPGYHVLKDTGVTIGMTMPYNSPETLNVGATYRVAVKGGSYNSAQAAITDTFFSSTSSPNFGGAEYHEVYLGAVGSTPPGTTNTNYPYTNTFASRRWYQSAMALLPFYTTAPYGTNHGFSVNNVANGLFRDENGISVITNPTFRLGFFMGFKEGRSRWLAQGNPRALMGLSGNCLNSPIDSGSWPTSLTPIGINKPRAHAGMNLKYSSSTPVDAQLFEFRPADQPLLSIGQLQHANTSWFLSAPSYAIGNSLLPAGYNSQPDKITSLVSNPNWSFPAYLITSSYDHSWLLNHALWDRYFVSTVPHKGTGVSSDTEIPPTPIPATGLASSLLKRREGATEADLHHEDRASSGLMLSGGFNINSTSEQAWRAVLGGINQLVYDPVTQATLGKRKVVMSRFSRPKNAAPATINSDNAWTGYRELTDVQIARLAKEIVAEIRRRGPSISLSDFINRRLKDTGAFPLANDKRLKGTIQAAIDATVTGVEAINSSTSAPFSAATTPLITDNYATNSITNPAMTGAASGSPSSAIRVAPFSSPSAFAPQFLTQGDVLSAIGSNLAGRSDTFTIRAYGEVLNPAQGTSANPQITGRAWCEAVVQRLPEYSDTTATPNAYSPPSGTTNIQFGRRYKIISFRWLSSNDI